jgi:hypothetical protein
MRRTGTLASTLACALLCGPRPSAAQSVYDKDGATCDATTGVLTVVSDLPTPQDAHLEDIRHPPILNARASVGQPWWGPDVPRRVGTRVTAVTAVAQPLPITVRELLPANDTVVCRRTVACAQSSVRSS